VGESGVSAMFMGEFLHNIDAKGRLIIPAKYRDQLNSTVIVTRGLDGCLTVYTDEQWLIRYQELLKLPQTKKETRMYVHMVMSKAAECEIDTQGRINLPSRLISEIGITKECVITGLGNHFQIWSKNRWDEYMALAESSYEENAESMTGFLV
jgi:MraZ protein